MNNNVKYKFASILGNSDYQIMDHIQFIISVITILKYICMMFGGK